MAQSLQLMTSTPPPHTLFGGDLQLRIVWKSSLSSWPRWMIGDHSVDWLCYLKSSLPLRLRREWGLTEAERRWSMRREGWSTHQICRLSRWQFSFGEHRASSRRREGRPSFFYWGSQSGVGISYSRTLELQGCSVVWGSKILFLTIAGFLLIQLVNFTSF